MKIIKHPVLCSKFANQFADSIKAHNKIQQKIIPLLHRINGRNVLFINTVILLSLFAVHMLMLVSIGLPILLATLVLDLSLLIALAIINSPYWIYKTFFTIEQRNKRKLIRNQIRIAKIESQRLLQIEQDRAKQQALMEQRKQQELELDALRTKLKTLSTDQLLELYALAKEDQSYLKYLNEIDFALNSRHVSTESKQLAISNYRLELNRLEILNLQAQQRAAQQIHAEHLNQELQVLLQQQKRRRISLGVGFWF